MNDNAAQPERDEAEQPRVNVLAIPYDKMDEVLAALTPLLSEAASTGSGAGQRREQGMERIDLASAFGTGCVFTGPATPDYVCDDETAIAELL